MPRIFRGAKGDNTLGRTFRSGVTLSPMEAIYVDAVDG
jgi:hypothetical protein